MKITPFNEVDEALQKAVDWLGNLGISVTNTRIGAYRKNISLLVDLLKKGNRDDLNRLYPTMVNSLYEAHELINIYHGLKNVESEDLVHRLEELLKGPEWFTHENVSSSNRSRNTAFELAIMSKIASHGIQPDPATSADLAFPMNTKKLIVECKRPQSAAAVKKNIRTATKQLKKRFQTSIKQNVRGIVAIDISKVRNPSFQMLEVENTASLDTYLPQSITWFIDSFGGLWKNKKHKKIIGILVRFTGMALLKDMNMLAYFQQWGLEPLSKIGVADHDTAMEVGELFRM